MAVRQGDVNINENKSEKPAEVKAATDGGRMGTGTEGSDGGHVMAGGQGAAAETGTTAFLRAEAAVEAVRAELEQAWLDLHKQLQHCEREHLQRVETFVLSMPWYGGTEQAARWERGQAALEAAGKEARAAADQASTSFLQVVSRQLTSGPHDRRLLLAIATSLQQLAFDLRAC